jgi:hypothetical protein
MNKILFFPQISQMLRTEKKFWSMEWKIHSSVCLFFLSLMATFNFRFFRIEISFSFFLLLHIRKLVSPSQNSYFFVKDGVPE